MYEVLSMPATDPVCVLLPSGAMKSALQFNHSSSVPSSVMCTLMLTINQINPCQVRSKTHTQRTMFERAPDKCFANPRVYHSPALLVYASISHVCHVISCHVSHVMFHVCQRDVISHRKATWVAQQSCLRQ